MTSISESGQKEETTGTKMRGVVVYSSDLIFENKLLGILRKVDQEATVAHLAYHNTLMAPVKVKPTDGIFLEYVAINRNYSVALSDKHLQSLKDNLEVFPKETAHILEYWLDVSVFSQRNPNKLMEMPWKQDFCERDIELYRSLGAISITTFAAWISSDYIRDFGEEKTIKILNEYWEVLNKKDK